MAESLVGVLEPGSPTKKLHSFQRTIGANAVEDEVVLLGEQYLAGYSAASIAIGCTVANAHLFQLMAGSSLKVRIRKISAWVSASTAAGAFIIDVLRLTSAGTGGTSITPSPLDPADGASNAVAMQAITSGGAEGVRLFRFGLPASAAAPQPAVYYEWHELPNQKPIVIPAGTTNGIVLKNINALAGSGILVSVEFDESNF